MQWIVKDFLAKNSLTSIRSFPVMWSGWECDTIWYLCVDAKGQKVLVCTNHGLPYIGRQDDLIDRIENYTQALDATSQILKSLRE